MPVEFHFRKADYEKYDDFTKFSPFGDDERTKIDLPVGLRAMYHYLMEKLKNRKITLYQTTGEGRMPYATLEPPHRKAVLQRILSQHLALEYWVKKVKLNELNDLVKMAEERTGRIIVRLDKEIDSHVRTLNSPRSVNFVFNSSARGIFSKPDIFGTPLFSLSFAFSYALACYLYDSPLIPTSWKEGIKADFVDPMAREIRRTIEEVGSFVKSVLEEPPSITEILYGYLEKHGEVSFTPMPPLDLLTEIQKYGYDVYDLQYAANDLYNKGLVDVENEMRPDGTRKFRKIWLKRD